MVSGSIYFRVLDWLQAHLFTCWFKAIFHVDCPGCGFQRSVIQLMRGNLADSFHLYPATVPILLILAFTAVHLRMKFRHGAAILKFAYLFAATVVVVSYIVKLKTLHLI